MVNFMYVQNTGLEGSHNPRIAKSREFATFGGCGWQLWSRGCTGFWFDLDVFISRACRTQVEGPHNPQIAKSLNLQLLKLWLVNLGNLQLSGVVVGICGIGCHNPRIAKSREFATFGGCGWQLWSKFPQPPNLQLLGGCGWQLWSRVPQPPNN